MVILLSLVHCLVKKKNLYCYKRLKTSQMNSACRKRRAECTGKLLQRFSIHSLLRLVFQDEKDFSLQVSTNRQNNRVYFNGHKKDVQPERLYSEGNKFLKKVMVSAVTTWKVLISLSLLVEMESKWKELPTWSISVMT